MATLFIEIGKFIELEINIPAHKHLLITIILYDTQCYYLPAKNPVSIHPEDHQTEVLPLCIAELLIRKENFPDKRLGAVILPSSPPHPIRTFKWWLLHSNHSHGSLWYALEGTVALRSFLSSLFSLPVRKCVCSCFDILPHPQAQSSKDDLTGIAKLWARLNLSLYEVTISCAY